MLYKSFVLRLKYLCNAMAGKINEIPAASRMKNTVVNMPVLSYSKKLYSKGVNV